MSDPIPAIDAPPPELAPFSPEWYDANVQAQQQLVNQRYADWQQALGALSTLVALRDLAQKQQAAQES
jgi:hypothetical protein